MRSGATVAMFESFDMKLDRLSLLRQIGSYLYLIEDQGPILIIPLVPLGLVALQCVH